MARYRTTVDVPTAPTDTFDYLARFDTAAEWDPGVVEARMVTPAPVGEGSRFALVARFAGSNVRLEYEILEHDRPRKVVLRAQNSMVTSLDTITFEPTTVGTAVTYDAVLEGRGVFRLADPPLALAFRRIGDAAAAGLASTLTARAQEQLA